MQVAARGRQPGREARAALERCGVAGHADTLPGTPYRTDDGAGPVTAYQGAAAAPPLNGIPPAQ